MPFLVCNDTFGVHVFFIGNILGIYSKTGGDKGGVTMKKILLPVDSDKLSERTLEYVKDFAVTQGYEVTVIHVIPYVEALSHPHLATVYGLHHETFEHVANDLVQKIEMQLKEVGITPVKTIVKKGNPASEIVELAEGQEFHLIIMNTRGLDLTKRITIGSVTNKVIHNSYVPVLVIQ